MRASANFKVEDIVAEFESTTPACGDVRWNANNSPPIGAAKMSLSLGTGPFGPERNGTFESGPLPDHTRYWEPWPRRMRAILGGETVLDSRAGIILSETAELAAFYYPLKDMRAGFLNEAEPEDGIRRWNLNVRDRVIETCVIASPKGADGGELLKGYVTLKFDSMDRWFEEDDPIYAHPRDPYHRVDVLSSSRHVVVRHGNQVVADCKRPKLLFETGVPIRYYLPWDDVEIGLLTKSETVSKCPYKGDGQHWHLQIGSEKVNDAAWTLPHPLPEGLAAAKHVCFYPDKVQIEVDGERVSE